MTELVHLEVDDRVAVVTLDSEHNRNALSRQLVTELDDRLARAGADPEVRAVHLRSAHRVFCSGADLSEASQLAMADGTRAIVGLQRRIATLPVPVVVELAGPVRAGGLGLVGAADVVLAAEPVTFALTEVRLGLAAATISLSLLPRMTSRSVSELFLTARTFDASEAVAIGLVTRAVPAEGLAGAVRTVLDDLVQGSPQGLRETKELVNRAMVDGFDARGEEMAELSARLFGSEEAREAMLAFLDRGRS